QRVALLHDAHDRAGEVVVARLVQVRQLGRLASRERHLVRAAGAGDAVRERDEDRKSTRLNSSHGSISYAVFCLKKKKTHTRTTDLDKHVYRLRSPKTKEGQTRFTSHGIV